MYLAQWMLYPFTYLNPDVTKFSQGSRAAWLHQNGATCRYKISTPNSAKKELLTAKSLSLPSLLPFLWVFGTTYAHTFHLHFSCFLHARPVVFSRGSLSLSMLARLPVLVQNEGWSSDGVAEGEVVKKVDISRVQPVLKEALDNLWEGGDSGQPVIANRESPLHVFYSFLLD